ncbi:MAG: HXXEE domain-containing protein [Terracidiphilus sp.]
MPLIFLFWFMVLTYVIHILDESLLGGSFVEKVQQHWWPEYSWTKFFWFNTGYFAIMIASVVTFDLRGGAWVVLPLAWAIERFGNACWHVWWTIRFREYSPGLLTSMLMFLNVYFLVRYWPELFRTDEAIAAIAIGALATAFLCFYIPVVKGRARRR